MASTSELSPSAAKSGCSITPKNTDLKGSGVKLRKLEFKGNYYYKIQKNSSIHNSILDPAPCALARLADVIWKNLV